MEFDNQITTNQEPITKFPEIKQGEAIELRVMAVQNDKKGEFDSLQAIPQVKVNVGSKDVFDNQNKYY